MCAPTVVTLLTALSKHPNPPSGSRCVQAQSVTLQGNEHPPFPRQLSARQLSGMGLLNHASCWDSEKHVARGGGGIGMINTLRRLLKRTKLYADPDNQTYDRVGFYKGVARTFFNPATPLSIKARGDKVSACVTGSLTARHVPRP